MFTLAHLSDVHLGDVALPSLGALMGKRALGYASWRLRRCKVHRGHVLDALVRDLRAHKPDHTVVTGDLVNISLPAEFRRAAAWLAGLGPAGDVSVIPGNHDAYVPISWEHSLGHWFSYMCGDHGEPEAHPARAAGFPYLRRRGPLAIIGVSTAAPMPAHLAAGRIGDAQLARLAALLEETGQPGICRVVLIHHPPTSAPAYRRKQLLDGRAFCEVVAGRGAELILHGHTHMSSCSHLPTPKGAVPVVGVPSASALPTHRHDHARYHLYRIAQDGKDWRIEVEVRGLDQGLERFGPEEGFVLDVAA
jgi:3',5'-cyclic AMP phosphodiesterase CpdA